MKAAQFQVVAGFTVTPQIQLLLGSQLVMLQKSVGGNLLTINAPEQAPAQLPRVVLRLSDAVLNVALDRFEVVVVPPQHVADSFSAALTFVRNRVTPILKPLASSMPAYQWSGCVAEVEFHDSRLPDATPEQTTTSLFDRLTTIDRRDRKITQFGLSFATREGGFFIGYNVHEFEYRKLELQAPTSRRVVVSSDQLEIGECGINVVIDVNNRPARARTGMLNDITAILAEQQRRFDSLADDLNLGGVLV